MTAVTDERVLNTIGLARRGGNLAVGEEPVAEVCKGRKARAVLLAAECLAAGVENGGIWAPPNWVHAGLAVLLYAFLCISTVLRGPLFGGQEGEDSL